MIAVYEQFDNLSDRFVGLVSSRFGAPTCTKGCSNCCRVSVGATTAEASNLLAWMDERPPETADRLHGAISAHVVRLREICTAPGADPSEIHRAVWALGDCPFLEDHVCSIYAARPLSCRAVYVWHDSSLCGLENQPSLTPAELIQLRNAAFFDALEDEIDAGRLPFWGQLTLVADILRRHRDAYSRGDYLRALVDPLWIESGLIHFAGIDHDGTADDAQRYVRQAAARNDDIFRTPRPHGLPRALAARRREDLLPQITTHSHRRDEREAPDVLAER